jgi:hypothetical protein
MYQLSTISCILPTSSCRPMRAVARLSISICSCVGRLRVGDRKESMGAAQLPQSGDAGTVPYITVCTDARGGACWAVIGLGTVVRCYSGHHAIAVLEMMCSATGVPTPS